MVLRFYPGLDAADLKDGYNEAKGCVGKELKDLSKYHKDVFEKVRAFLTKLKGAERLQDYITAEEISRFPGTDLYEMRIPKQRRGGVFRIYFCSSLEEGKTNELILLDAEFKHKKEPMRLDSARKKLKQYYKSFGKEI